MSRGRTRGGRRVGEKRSYCFESKKVASRRKGRKALEVASSIDLADFVAKTIRIPSHCFLGQRFLPVGAFERCSPSALARPVPVSIFFSPFLPLVARTKEEIEKSGAGAREKMVGGWRTPRLFPNFSSSRNWSDQAANTRTLWQKIVSNRHTNDSR